VHNAQSKIWDPGQQGLVGTALRVERRRSEGDQGVIDIVKPPNGLAVGPITEIARPAARLAQMTALRAEASTRTA
jgi:ATP-dependent protease HslVU (ClpYQ) ATPase subunit